MDFDFVLPYCRIDTKITVFLKYHNAKFDFHVRILFKILRAKISDSYVFLRKFSKASLRIKFNPSQPYKQISIKYARKPSD